MLTIVRHTRNNGIPMQHIVIDTNCLVQMISLHSPYRKGWDAFLNGNYVLCVSNDIIEEYQEILGIVANETVASNIVYAILRSPFTHFCDPQFKFQLIEKDNDDNKFVDCAIIANARFIVSQDHHFDILKTITFPKVDVISIDDFMETL